MIIVEINEASGIEMFFFSPSAGHQMNAVPI